MCDSFLLGTEWVYGGVVSVTFCLHLFSKSRHHGQMALWRELRTLYIDTRLFHNFLLVPYSEATFPHSIIRAYDRKSDQTDPYKGKPSKGYLQRITRNSREKSIRLGLPESSPDWTGARPSTNMACLCC